MVDEWKNYIGMARKHGYALHLEGLHIKYEGQDGCILVERKCITLMEDTITRIGNGYLIDNLGII